MDVIRRALTELKEVWGAGQQQVRNLDSNVAAFTVNGWMDSLTEAWAWDKPEALVCYPKSEPGGMRVSEPREGRRETKA